MGIDLVLLQDDKGGNIESIRASQRLRFDSVELVDEVHTLYKKWVHVTYARSQLQKDINNIQKAIGMKMKVSIDPLLFSDSMDPEKFELTQNNIFKQAKENADDLKAEKVEIEKKAFALVEEAKTAEEVMRKAAGTIGNLVHESVPVFASEVSDIRLSRTRQNI